MENLLRFKNSFIIVQEDKPLMRHSGGLNECRAMEATPKIEKIIKGLEFQQSAVYNGPTNQHKKFSKMKDYDKMKIYENTT